MRGQLSWILNPQIQHKFCTGSCKECFYHKKFHQIQVSEKKIPVFKISANKNIQLALESMFQVHVEDYSYHVW